ncbi:hypothetical protein Dsin_023601 [Dipteronia sinensis]|uniref:FLZ-type domain-containing protein n=1 Tax=Dipteronia sinensis TaxID=43782 RepID=A0AAE0E119_9ROSI|nr:hypothetical protein Dsin_023601 [Dipteronia sinensis]
MVNWDSHRDDLDTLKSELENLIETKNYVMRRIQIAEEEQQQPMKPTTEVQLWLSSLQAVETEVDELIKGASEEIEKLHPGGMNISMLSSSYYELEDMVADKLEAVTNLIKEGAFLVADEVPVVTTLIDEGAPEVAVAETIPAEDVADDQLPIVGMESIFKKVWKCVKKGGGGEEEEEEEDEDEDEDDDDDDNDDVGIIGVYGMGGVGKTTLLEQMNKKLDLEMKNDFDVVIWVVVSRDLQLGKIQQQIGRKIGLFDNKAWKHKNFEEKASDIFKILEEKKFVLLMDDLWGRVDLTKVGVPLPSSRNPSKIVFTTRSLQICSLMGAGKLFKVTCLSDDDAWKLFQTLVGDETLHAHPEVPEIARDVSRACYGLPLALVSFGRAMASKKTPQEWSDVLEVLLMSSNSGSDYELKESIYYNLKLSYDILQDDMFKSCLLYCCLFPRNNEISKRELIDCWIGEGFLDERIGAQSQGYYIIGVLLSTCLLEEGKDGNGVKMHNWIHEMSWWIANEIEGEKGNLFFCTIEAPQSKKWENVTRISVMKNMTRNLLDAPKSPHLQTLFLYKNDLQIINSDFFQFLPSLRVLNLSRNFFLTKLPSGISNLVSLQHLDLSRTYIRELPDQLGELKKLKCLNLEETYGLHTIPKQLISKFSMLHVLRLWDCGFMLQSTSDSAAVCNDAQLLIEELLCLKNLSMLSITLNNSHALQRLLSSNRLQSCTESLYLQYLYHPKSIKVPLTDLKHLNTLNILNCVYLEEVVVDFVGETQAIRESPRRFYFLDKVIIKGCAKLWDLTWLILAPNLKSLEISDCFRMEEIINVGKLSPELMGNVIPFSKLKRLILVRLPKLRSIYWRVLPFPDVKELTIADCPMPPLPPHLLNKVDVTSVVSWTRSPIWKPRDTVKLVKKEKINKEKPEGAYTRCKLPEVKKKSFVGEVKRDSDFKILKKVELEGSAPPFFLQGEGGAPRGTDMNNHHHHHKHSSSSPSPPSITTFPAPIFSRQCFLCKQTLLPGRDIYMYKGDICFCSMECRQIFMDEEESLEKYNCSVATMKVNPTSASSASSSSSSTSASRHRHNYRKGTRNGAGGFVY